MISGFKKNYLNAVLLVAIFLSLWSLSFAVTPNPGHLWTEVGDGTFIVSGPSVARTYTFPDASTTVLTTNSLVSVAQGGTGTSSLSGVLLGNGTSAVTATTSPAGLLVGTTETQTLTGKTINLNNNSLTDNSMGLGDLFKFNGTRYVRLARGSALQLLRTNAAADDLEWATVSSDPAGSNQELQYNDGGSAFGATSSLTWDNSNQSLKLGGVLELTSSTWSGTPATGTMKLVNTEVAGRGMLGVATSFAGNNYALQPSLFQNRFVLITTGGSSSIFNYGESIGSSGTVSHISPTEATGYLVNFAATAVSSTAAGVQASAGSFYRGSTDGMNGFFMFARVYFPDTSYDQVGVGTGSRLYVGFGNVNGVANSAVSENPSGDHVGFTRSSTNDGRQDVYWTLMTKDNTTLSLSTTSMAFATSTIYDMYLYCPPQGSSISWRIDNLANSTSDEGVLTANLPRGSSRMSVGAYVFGVNAVARNIRLQKIYVEVPR